MTSRVARLLAAGALPLLTAAIPAPAHADTGDYTLAYAYGTGSPGAATPGPASQSAIAAPLDVTFDASGNLYVTASGSCQIDKITPGGTLSVVAGTGTCTPGATSGPAASTAIGTPGSVLPMADGSLYFGETDTGRLYKVSTGGQLSVIAGTGTPGAMTTGPATSSRLDSPGQLVYSDGALYVPEREWGQVGRIDLASGQLTVIAGTGTNGGPPVPGPATSSPLDHPVGAAMDASGNLYVTTAVMDGQIVKITPGGTLSVAKSALAVPLGLRFHAGELYLTESAGAVSVVDPDTGSIGTFAGSGEPGGLVPGPAMNSPINVPYGMAFDASGTLFVSVPPQHRVIQLNPAPRVPAAPTITSVTARNQGAEVTFTPGSDGGSTVLQYEYTADGTTWHEFTTTATGSGAARTGTINGLTNGQAYTVRVRAVNAVGNGDPSAGSQVTPAAPAEPTVPDAPGTVTATAGVSSITVSWTAPAPGSNAEVTGYTATASPGPATCTTTGALTCVLGATAGTTYAVTVVANSDAGPSSPAGPSAPVTALAPAAPATVPDTPLTLTTDQGDISSTRPGAQLTVIGTGFAAYSTVEVTLYSAPQSLGTAVTDASGNFTKTVTVPADLTAGAHTVLAQGVAPDGTARAMKLTVTVAPPSSSAALPVTGDPVARTALSGLLALVGGAALLLGAARTRPGRHSRLLPTGAAHNF
ncbi:fibronectin type III domain-containing protein [Dactylosporangium sp. NPDC000244]|uniref:fibronectin type III domain-containing protein n=1 Tax=Dactylosporangium sp. NPDC000244 TaxID=3154365 RepID=UPI0033192364